MMFLTKDEVCELTGTKRKPSQIEWLRQHHYKFEIGIDGRPKILKTYIEERFGMINAREKKSLPNFAAV